MERGRSGLRFCWWISNFDCIFSFICRQKTQAIKGYFHWDSLATQQYSTLSFLPSFSFFNFFHFLILSLTPSPSHFSWRVIVSFKHSPFLAMDFCRNVTVSTEYHQQEKVLASPPPCSKLGAAAAALTATTSPLDDPFSAQNTVGFFLFVSFTCFFMHSFCTCWVISLSSWWLNIGYFSAAIFLFWGILFLSSYVCVQFFLLLLVFLVMLLVSASCARFCLDNLLTSLCAQETWKVTVFAGFYLFLCYTAVFKIIFA